MDTGMILRGHESDVLAMTNSFKQNLSTIGTTTLQTTLKETMDTLVADMHAAADKSLSEFKQEIDNAMMDTGGTQNNQEGT